ncbi:hypothetical protein K2X85_07040 [bacterium]|nr:hypothetical protein [bacterium]
MSSEPLVNEYEFNDQQNRLIGDLARKMGMVGFVIVFFGAIQIFQAVAGFISTRNPDRILAAAKEAGVAEPQMKQLETVLTSGGWMSPIAMTAVAVGLVGLMMVMMGLWTQQAAAGFGGIALTKGQDIRRLMDALGAMHKKYSLIYNILWVAAIMSLVSLGFSLYQMWLARGSA